MQRDHEEHFWNAIIWPILWPMFLIQATLIVLCLLVGLAVWWMSPSEVSWSTTLWLALALLLGSTMNVCAFLMLVKMRARQKDAHFMQELAELERHSESLRFAAVQMLPDKTFSTPAISQTPVRPLKRLTRVNEMLAGLVHYIGGVQRLKHAAQPSKDEQALLDDIHHQQQQLKHLIAGRDRAREESRLKTGYLSLLQRETDDLNQHLGRILESDECQSCRQQILDIRERLADARALLANLVYQSVNDDEVLPGVPTANQALRVLVVDDGPVNLMLARQMLEAQGLNVEGVSSGEQALERQQSTQFDLVFMDIFMPTLDGLETTRRWRAFEQASGKHRSILVALTANADNAGMAECNEAGMDDLLTKPYQPEKLLGMISKWLPNKAGKAST
ncbi:response regulator [Halomonas aquamarina]|uniref:Response regulator n=1 Tax=Vreelandella aquamarina TaxID=77097 RepID=A0ACC5VQS0_9GAMM|nr:response regulator [Halomonas aquamarina]MBZ5486422.1 response regulator [Halomonas aquamarina]